MPGQHKFKFQLNWLYLQFLFKGFIGLLHIFPECGIIREELTAVSRDDATLCGKNRMIQ